MDGGGSSSRYVPWQKWLVVGLSQWRPQFDYSGVFAGFVANKVALCHNFLQALQFSPVSYHFISLQHSPAQREMHM